MSTSEPLLKTRQVAEALGVSASTVKRWVDSGALAASRTVGKHRLVPLAEALRLARAQELPASRIRALMGAGRVEVPCFDAARAELVAALTRGDAGGACRLLTRAYAGCRRPRRRGPAHPDVGARAGGQLPPRRARRLPVRLARRP